MHDNSSEKIPSFDDEYREKEEMFGNPYKELQDYFSNLAKRGTVLDLGCGQGRDALFLTSLGFQVTAVDSSQVGVAQMIKLSKEKGVKIKGIIDDVFNLQLPEKFDVILFDMLLHTFEKHQQLELLTKYSSYLKKNGVLCIVFPDDMKTKNFMNILNSLPHKWDLLDEVTIRDVPKLSDNVEGNKFIFVMIVVRLLS